MLSEQDGWTHRPYPFREGPGRFRDPRLYYLAIFGDPAGAAPWAWRFEGHHIALHYAVHDGAVASASPAFLGAHPAETTLSVGNVLRPLADVEDAGRELARSLDTAQRASALTNDGDDLTVTVRSWDYPTYADPAAEGDPGQQCDAIEVQVDYEFTPSTPLAETIFGSITMVGRERLVNEPFGTCG